MSHEDLIILNNYVVIYNLPKTISNVQLFIANPAFFRAIFFRQGKFDDRRKV
ncbi:MAG: hypothetical protein ACTSYY_03725 [Promethearchaeota archaeon]